MPKMMRNTGNSAGGGIARRKWTVGSTNSLSTWERPIANPNAIDTIAARTKP